MDTQCELHAGLFGDEQDPSSGFSCAELPEKPGSHNLSDAYQRPVSLEVVSAVVVPVRKLYPQSFAEGDGFSCLWGWMKGSSGKVPVLMGAIHKPSLISGSSNTLIYVVKVLTVAEIEEVSHVERLLAGTRIVNSTTGKSYSLASLSGRVDAYADASDLSTLYSADPQSGTGDSTIDCISIAYKRFAATTKSNQNSLAICLAASASAWALAAAGCTLALLAPQPANIVYCLGCEAIVLAAYVFANKVCESYYRNAEQLALANLLLDLQACGVHTADL